MLFQCKNTREHLSSKHSQQQGDTQLNSTVRHDIRPKRTRAYSFSILQHRAQLAPTGLLESTQAQSCCYSTDTHHALFTFLAKCVTHVVYSPMLLPIWMQQSVSWRHSSSTESGLGQTCEGGEADFDEGSTAGGVEQRSAATRRHLAQEPAAPRDQCHPISYPWGSLIAITFSLSVGQNLLPFLILCSLFCRSHFVFPPVTVYWMCLPHQTLSLLLLAVSVSFSL